MPDSLKPPYRAAGPRARERRENRQFEKLQATQLYCPTCGRAMPVVERLLLVLPEGDKYEYLCVNCGTSVGERIVKDERPVSLIV